MSLSEGILMDLLWSELVMYNGVCNSLAFDKQTSVIGSAYLLEGIEACPL